MKEIRGFDLEKAIQSVLEEYASEANEIISEEANAVAKETVKKLKATSPKNKGGYASGWTSKTERSAKVSTATVYNRKKPGLAHLLENGHANRNGGRTQGIRHIDPAAEAAEKNFLNRLKERL